MRSGGNARLFEDSLAWLSDSGLILTCTRVHSIQTPLEAYYELNIFKVYLFDTGLLMCQLDESCAAHILQDSSMIYKGALYENLAAQMLHARGKKLFCFEPNTRSEIDFLLSRNMEIIPVETKASHNTKSKSLQAYVDKHKPPYALKFSANNINTKTNIKCFPFYMIMFL